MFAHRCNPLIRICAFSAGIFAIIPLLPAAFAAVESLEELGGLIGRVSSGVGCGDPDAGDCHVPHPSPYCNDQTCCENVCALDSFCCEGEWDLFCVGEADAVCNCAAGSAPSNDDCPGALFVNLGDTPINNICATAGGPSHPNCNDTVFPGLGLDVWYTYTATFSGELAVSTCNLVEPEWDTQIAVYAGCNCGDLGNPLGCNNDALGCSSGSSRVAVNVQQGTCYTIRVGSSFTGPAGSGTLRLLAPCDLLIPPEALPEGETCGESFNGGCDNLPPDTPTFTSVQCGDVIHGSLWSTAIDEDGDWFELTLTEPRQVTLTIESEFEYRMGIKQTSPPGSGNCSEYTGIVNPVQFGPSCIETPLTTILTSGTWWPFVGPGTFDDISCSGASDYVLRIGCTDTCPADLNDDGLTNAADLAVVLGNWGPNPGHPADFNEDGVINAADLAQVLGLWGPCFQPCVTDGDCNDGMPCNGAETCVESFCQPGTPVVCDDNNICTDDSCNPVTGNCLFETIDCDDHDVCTTDQCGAATGCYALPVLCDDNDACTSNSCDPDSGCLFDAIVCDDSNPCTDDTCDPVSGCVFTPNDGNTCEDGNACNGNGSCLNGACFNEPQNCDDGDACTLDSCDPVTGCIHEPLNCDDNSACTTDSCDPAVGCINALIDCDDGNACTNECLSNSTIFSFDMDGGQDGNDVPGTGSCQVVLHQDTAEVSVSCTYRDLLGDAIASHIHGLAPPGQNAPVLVNLMPSGGTTGTVTGSGILSPEHVQGMLEGLTYVNVHSLVFPPGEIRGQVVNAAPLCCDPSSGCVSEILDCDDGDLCTVDSCDSVAGCLNEPVDCDDGDACTTDNCNPLTGGCMNEPINCDDENVCTTDGCDPASGCTHDALVCDDGNACTNDCPGTSNVYTFTLDGQQQVPQNESPGSGSCSVFLSQTTGFVTVSCTYEGLIGEAFVAHIHGLSPPGMNSPVIVPLTVSGGTSGTVSGSGTLSTSQILGMLEGLTYINIHTTAYTPGEIRGQIVNGTISCCDPELGCLSAPLACEDNNACTQDVCDPEQGCVHTLVDCDDGSACTNHCAGNETLFIHDMDGDQAGTGSPGTGSCVVMLEEDSGFVAADCTYDGLLGDAFAAHIHGLAAPGENAPILVFLTVSGGTSGTAQGNGTLSPVQIQGMLDGMTYINVHTDAFPPGETRGQVVNPSELCCDPAAGCEQVPLICDDGQPCTLDQCDPVGGCFATPLECAEDEYCDPVDGCVAICSGDLTNDGLVNAADLAIFLGEWGDCPGCISDITGDGVVNASDLAILLAQWGTCPIPCEFDSDCDDLLFCTGQEFCSEGFCANGDPPNCDDGSVCTMDGCSAELDICVNDPIDCDDGDACTDDSCDPVTGCEHTPTDCSDADLCTIDGCDPLSGCAYDPVDCDDQDPCTIDSCDPLTGCIHTPDCD